jgi:hypothetical protein
MLQHPAGTVPSLFRQMLISSGKRREPTSTEITGQMTYPQVRQPGQKFEMYFDVSRAAAHHDLVPSLLLAAAAASAPQPSFWPGALAATGGGLLFTVLGFLLYSDYRNARRWLLGMTDASLEGAPLADSLRRFNTRVFSAATPRYSRTAKPTGCHSFLAECSWRWAASCCSLACSWISC